jgi:hypothetical protein
MFHKKTPWSGGKKTNCILYHSEDISYILLYVITHGIRYGMEEEFSPHHIAYGDYIGDNGAKVEIIKSGDRGGGGCEW